MKNDFKKRAIKILTKSTSIGMNKANAKDQIRSIGTLRSYTQCVKQYLEWRHNNDLPSHNQDSKKELMIYLDEFAEWYQQKTLCQHRMALSKAFNKKLQYIPAKRVTDVKSRVYTTNEIQCILKLLNIKDAVAVGLCFSSGLRAHELMTLCEVHERERSTTRVWSDNLFIFFEDFSVKRVTGKGGLTRDIAVPNTLDNALNKLRLPEAKNIKDRQVIYKALYDIGHGQNLSQKFTQASIKALGFSLGLHGCRHSYAQNRFRTLLKRGLKYEATQLIISQELGHFRPSVTNCYMR